MNIAELKSKINQLEDEREKLYEQISKYEEQKDILMSVDLLKKLSTLTFDYEYSILHLRNADDNDIKEIAKIWPHLYHDEIHIDENIAFRADDGNYTIFVNKAVSQDTAAKIIKKFVVKNKIKVIFNRYNEKIKYHQNSLKKLKKEIRLIKQRN